MTLTGLYNVHGLSKLSVLPLSVMQNHYATLIWFSATTQVTVEVSAEINETLPLIQHPRLTA